MSICSSGVAPNYEMPLWKPSAVLALDYSNIKFSAMDRGAFVDLRLMVSSLSRRFVITHKLAFVQPNGFRAWAFLEGCLGFEVFLRPYNADSLIGLKVGPLIRSGIDAIIVCTMDGGFASIEEEASLEGVEVYYVGFQDSYSFLLRKKNLIPLESLDCIKERKPKYAPANKAATSDSIMFDQEAT